MIKALAGLMLKPVCHKVQLWDLSLALLIYINFFAECLNTDANLFADKTSLFPINRDINASTEELSNDLLDISKEVYQWKIIFNTYLTKQEEEVIFSRKINKTVLISDFYTSQTVSQKHLDLILDNKVNFSEHLKGIIKKISKTIGLIHRFQPILQKFSLFTIYKTFVRPHLDYEDVIYGQTYNEISQKT